MLLHFLPPALLSFLLPASFPPSLLPVLVPPLSSLTPLLSLQIFRATANVLEVTNFAVTFYIYCVFSKDFRETFLRTLRKAKENSMGASFFGSVSGLKEAIRPP